jgi:hypothetical protein
MRKILVQHLLIGTFGLSGVASAAPSPPTPNAGCIPRASPSTDPLAALSRPADSAVLIWSMGAGIVGGIIAAATAPHNACL